VVNYILKDFNRQEILIHVEIYLHKLENYIIIYYIIIGFKKTFNRVT